MADGQHRQVDKVAASGSSKVGYNLNLNSDPALCTAMTHSSKSYMNLMGCRSTGLWKGHNNVDVDSSSC